MKYLLFLLLPLTLTSQSYICDSVFLVTKNASTGDYDRYVDAKAVSCTFMINEKQNIIVRSIDCNIVIYYNVYKFTQPLDDKPYIYYQSENDSKGQDVIFLDPYLNMIKYIDTNNDNKMYLFTVKKVILNE